MPFVYDLCMDTHGVRHRIAVYKTVRKAHEAFDLCTKVAPEEAVVLIEMREEKENA